MANDIKTKLKTKLEAKQLSNKKMLVKTEVDGVKISMIQNIGEIDMTRLERKADILLANTHTEKPVIKAKKKEDKTSDIAGYLSNAKSNGTGGGNN